jgi:RNA polymerase sigma-B factor
VPRSSGIDMSFEAYRRTRCPEVRVALIRQHLWLADRQARKYRGRGEEFDDLFQVASFGLVKAVERFQPERGVPFRSFAVPTMDGEIKRHFRDATWATRVPRRVKDEMSSVRNARETLTQELGRVPSSREIAERTDLAQQEVDLATTAAASYRTRSLESATERPDGWSTDPCVDAYDDQCTDHLDALQALRQLDRASCQVVYMTYFLQRTQREIASSLGMGQVQVSRMLRKALARLRTELGDTWPGSAAPTAA